MNDSNGLNGCGTNESHRWWDVYVIRYAVGIVIGAICMHYLFKNFNVDIESVLFIKNEADATNVYTSWATLALFGVYGFVYTYLARDKGHPKSFSYIPFYGKVNSNY
jgi:hypothetical protein